MSKNITDMVVESLFETCTMPGCTEPGTWACVGELDSQTPVYLCDEHGPVHAGACDLVRDGHAQCQPLEDFTIEGEQS